MPQSLMSSFLTQQERSGSSNEKRNSIGIWRESWQPFWNCHFFWCVKKYFFAKTIIVKRKVKLK